MPFTHTPNTFARLGQAVRDLLRPHNKQDCGLKQRMTSTERCLSYQPTRDQWPPTQDFSKGNSSMTYLVLLWTECVPVKFIYQSPNPQYDGNRRWGLWEVIRSTGGHEGRAPMLGLMALQPKEETLELSFSTLWKYSLTICKPGWSPHQKLNPPAPWSFQPLVLKEINICCSSHPGYGILLK